MLGSLVGAWPAGAVPFADLWQPKDPPAYVAGQAPPAASGSAVTVAVSPSTVIRPISPATFGSNCAVWNGEMLLTTGVKASLRRGGFSVLRFPGGSTSDQYCWDNNYTSANKAYPGNDFAVMNGSWAVNTDEYINVCRATGAEPMITVNAGLARYGSTAEAADLAARWVKYCNVDHNYGVRYWEVGNENYGDWERGTVFPEGSTNRLSGDQYGAIFNQIAAAMKAVDPTISIGAVGLGDDNLDPYTGYYGWMRKMLPVVQDSADFISVHNYFIWLGGTVQVPASTLFGNLGQIGAWKNNLDAMIAAYTHRQPGDIPYAMTEFNIENPPKHDTVELTNGLFTAAALGEFARTGWSAANLWDVLNGWDTTTLGDHAMLAVNQPGVANGTQRASFYAYVLWSLFGDTLVSSTSSVTGVKVYAGTYAGGGTSVMMVNTDAAGHTVTLSGLPDRAPAANAWVLSGTGYTARDVSFNGVQGPVGGGPVDTAACPAYTVTLPPTGAVTLGMPAASVTLLVMVPPYVPGDADGDGTVDLRDAVLSARAVAGLTALPALRRRAADLNADGVLNAADVAQMVKTAGGA